MATYDNSFQNETKECEPSSTFHHRFYELIIYLKSQTGLNLQEIYQKNVDILRKSLKIQRKMPDLEQIENLFNGIFMTKTNNHQDYCLKSFFIKTKIIFVWLISVYERLNKKPLRNFDNNDWEKIAMLIPKTDPLNLKYKWFTYMIQSKCDKFWTSEQDLLLNKTIKTLHPEFFKSTYENVMQKDISWAIVSFELSKEIQIIHHLKTNKQCKERWFNHLNPFLNRNIWSLEDDITLMLECLKSPKEWSKIARNFPGRTQHQTKNRFLRVLSMELCLKRKKISDMMKKNSIAEIIYETLKSLKFRKQGNNLLFFYDQKDEQPDVNEIRKRSYSFNNKIFQENAVDRFFHNENKEQTIEDFIKFDL